MEADAATNRYRSRILREMSANRENPFRSPPSSTGSHGTVSPTLSSVFSDPDGESTRKLNEEIAHVTGSRRGTSKSKIQVNWEAAHRKWPEFYGIPKAKTQNATYSTELTSDNPAKENIPPRPFVKVVDDSTQETWQGSKRTRAEMQPRVDNDSDASSIAAKSPLRPPRSAQQIRQRSPLATNQSRNSPDPPVQAARRQSLNEMVKDAVARQQTSRGAQSKPPHRNLEGIRNTLQPPTSFSSPTHNATSRSFFMPDVSHLGDFVSGTLRFGGAKNGIPVFVKHGKVRDRVAIRPPNDHAEVDGIEIPEDEEKIFVSMDMIREEIGTLQEHDEVVQKYAEGLQDEVDHLKSQLNQVRHRKSIDSGLGSRSGSESDCPASGDLLARNAKLEGEVASLQKRLDQAVLKISTNEVANTELSAERDSLVKKLQAASEEFADLANRLDSREQELRHTQKQLNTTQQMHQDNESHRHEVVAKHSHNTLRLENEALKADNATLRREKEALQQEVKSLRDENNSLRREQESLISENRSHRTSAKSRMDEIEDLRQTVDSLQQELDSTREEFDQMQHEVQVLEQEKASLKEDNDSLVRHNEKYFSENKVLRRENSGFERSIHDLHDENLRLKEEVEFLKQQLDHCRPIGRDDDFSGRLSRDEDEENMTSAFFVPDITIHSNENSAPVDMTSQSKKAPVLPEIPSHRNKLDIPETTGHTKESVTGPENTLQSERSLVTAPDAKSRTKGGQNMATSGEHQSQSHRVAFSIPESSKSKAAANVANQGSKRRNTSRMSSRSSFKAGSAPELDVFEDEQASAGPHSLENTENTQNRAAAASKSQKQSSTRTKTSSVKQTTATQNVRTTGSKAHASNHSRNSTKNLSVNLTAQSQGEDITWACPALSDDARRVLDSLTPHNCGNCVVCVRIAAHRGTVTSAEAAEGKKRVRVPRPVPATDRMAEAAEYTEEPTMRPSQPPGQALALVIKGLEDELAHMKMEQAKKQGRYNDHSASIGQRARKELAAEIKSLLRRMEVKNDQIYALYDVLEGQKQSGQAMTDEELELTILSITGVSMRDMSEQVTWDGIRE